ncbi:Hcp family type VI secretion system effector [Tundrisphaera sp. TA3]|uniref:Hcp family type VI secretion system effector n=1 Tax=Tundrisphaera sp. TA3 TaxID=3435775 RepID=UPI003EBBC8B1
MAYDSFMQIKGGSAPTGESTDTAYPQWIALQSFTFGASNPSTIGSSTPGSGSGKVAISSFNVTKQTDNSSPDLFLACCKGAHFDSATVVLRKAGGGQNVFLQYDFTEVYVDSVNWIGNGTTSGTASGDTPGETVSFSFASVKITYTPQVSKGGAKGTPNVKGWNVTTNTNV